MQSIFTYQALTFSPLLIVKKMKDDMDMLLLNQQSQLQVLQEIQKQLNILLPGNDLINSNVYSLGLLLGRQAAAAASLSFPLLNPRSLLPDNASLLSQSSAPGILPTTQLPISQYPAASTTWSALCCEFSQSKQMCLLFCTVFSLFDHMWSLCCNVEIVVPVKMLTVRSDLERYMPQMCQKTAVDQIHSPFIPCSMQMFWPVLYFVKAA